MMASTYSADRYFNNPENQFVGSGGQNLGKGMSLAFGFGSTPWDTVEDIWHPTYGRIDNEQQQQQLLSARLTRTTNHPDAMSNRKALSALILHDQELPPRMGIDQSRLLDAVSDSTRVKSHVLTSTSSEKYREYEQRVRGTLSNSTLLAGSSPDNEFRYNNSAYSKSNAASTSQLAQADIENIEEFVPANLRHELTRFEYYNPEDYKSHVVEERSNIQPSHGMLRSSATTDLQAFSQQAGPIPYSTTLPTLSATPVSSRLPLISTRDVPLHSQFESAKPDYSRVNSRGDEDILHSAFEGLNIGHEKRNDYRQRPTDNQTNFQKSGHQQRPSSHQDWPDYHAQHTQPFRDYNDGHLTRVPQQWLNHNDLIYARNGQQPVVAQKDSRKLFHLQSVDHTDNSRQYCHHGSQHNLLHNLGVAQNNTTDPRSYRGGKNLIDIPQFPDLNGQVLPLHYSFPPGPPTEYTHYSNSHLRDENHYGDDDLDSCPRNCPQGPMSELLEDFLYQFGDVKKYGRKIFRPIGFHKTFEMKDIYNHFVEFSLNQEASVWIQYELDSSTSDDRDQILSEILRNHRHTMDTKYGNWVHQKLFECGSQAQRTRLYNAMRNDMYWLSKSTFACRVVQKALDYVLPDQQVEMMQELEPHVMELMHDPQGNHVLAKAIATVPVQHLQFIKDALRSRVCEISRNKYGCRVVQRILESCDPSARRMIIDEIHPETASLSRNEYGNYVVQKIIVVAEPADRYRTIVEVQKDVWNYARLKFGSPVVETALRYCQEEQCTALIQGLLGDAGASPNHRVYELARNEYGNYVFQTALRMAKGEQLDAIICHIECWLPKLRTHNPHGKPFKTLEATYRQAKMRQRNPNGDHSPTTSCSTGTSGTSESRRSSRNSSTGQVRPTPRVAYEMRGCQRSHNPREPLSGHT